jgi:hypothetical protein
MQYVRIEEHGVSSAGNDAYYSGRTRERWPMRIHVQGRKTMAPRDESKAALFWHEVLEKHM